MKKILILMTACIFIVGSAFSQNNKTIIDNGIKTKISYDYDLKGKKEIKIKRLVEKFNIEGNLSEEIRYDKEEKQTKHFTYIYNKDNNLISKISYNNRGEIKKTTLYKYNDGLKISKLIKNEKGQIIEKENYEYTFK